MENQYEEFKSRRLEELAKMPPHPKYEPVPGLALPVGDALTVKEVPQSEYKTDAGLIIPGTTRLEHCKLGIVMVKGEMCNVPVKEGDLVAFDPSISIGISHKNVDYLKVPGYHVHFILPPDNYLEPHYADFFEKRRESRISGAKVAEKRDNNKLEQKFEDRDSVNKKKDYIPGVEGKGKTIIK